MSEHYSPQPEVPNADEIHERLLELWSNGASLSPDETAILLDAHPELSGSILNEGE